LRTIKSRLTRLRNEFNGEPFNFVDTIYLINEIMLLKEKGLTSKDCIITDVFTTDTYVGLVLKALENKKSFKNKNEFLKFIMK
jgi:hypothetical protein